MFWKLSSPAVFDTRLESAGLSSPPWSDARQPAELQSCVSLRKYTTKEVYPRDMPIEKKICSREYLCLIGPAIEGNHSATNLEFRYAKQSRRQVFHDIQVRVPIKGNSSKQGESRLNHIPDDEASFEELKKSVLQEVRLRLKRSRFFSINEIYKQVETREAFEAQLEEMKKLSQSLPNLASVGKKEFLFLCTDNKFQSKAVQTILESGPSNQQQAILSHCYASWPDLLKDKYGNYIVQQAVSTSVEFRLFLEQKCVADLDAMAANEYSSRVMQSLARESASFRRTALLWLSNRLELLIDNLPSVFLLTASIQAVTDPSDLACLRQSLFKETSRKVRDSRYFKRIVMSFAEKCSFADLDSVYYCFDLDSSLRQMLDERFGSLVVCAMVMRGHRATIKALVHQVKSDLVHMTKTKYFRVFLYRVTKDPASRWIKQTLFRALLMTNSNQVHESVKKPDSCYFVIFVATILMPIQSQPLLKKLNALINSPSSLARLLLSDLFLAAK